MSKLARKFILRLSALLIAVILLSLYLNSNFIGRYYLYREKMDMNRICDQLLNSINGAAGTQTASLRQATQSIEASEDVVIAWVSPTSDNDQLNQQLTSAFLEKGLGLDKYWLWQEDQQELLKNGRKMRLYYQPKLHYSLLIEYLSSEEAILAVAKIIPAISRTITLVNQVTAAVFAGAVLLLLLLTSILVKNITSPLSAIGKTAKAIAQLDFQTVQIRTGDELEQLAGDINHMSRQLKYDHQALEEKNRQMEELLSNVSHDLKTPVSLIKAYTCGMKDGLDDGTFLDTVISQNEQMEQMIERLLDLSRIKNGTANPQSIELIRFVKELLGEYQQPAKDREISLRLKIGETPGPAASPELDEAYPLMADPKILRTLLSNLISNAVKYAAGPEIEVVILKQEDQLCVTVRNQVSSDHQPDLDRIWEPFYVAEVSRNKHMSGTGLGLSIVKTAAAQQGYGCSCRMEQRDIVFELIFYLPQ